MSFRDLITANLSLDVGYSASLAADTGLVG